LGKPAPPPTGCGDDRDVPQRPRGLISLAAHSPSAPRHPSALVASGSGPVAQRCVVGTECLLESTPFRLRKELGEPDQDDTGPQCPTKRVERPVTSPSGSVVVDDLRTCIPDVAASRPGLGNRRTARPVRNITTPHNDVVGLIESRPERHVVAGAGRATAIGPSGGGLDRWLAWRPVQRRRRCALCLNACPGGWSSPPVRAVARFSSWPRWWCWAVVLLG
jgi:hypothetical protein